MLEGKATNDPYKGTSIAGECPKCSPRKATPTSIHGRCLDCGYPKFPKGVPRLL